MAATPRDMSRRSLGEGGSHPFLTEPYEKPGPRVKNSASWGDDAVQGGPRQQAEVNRGSFMRPTDQVTDQVGSLLRVLIHGPVTATDIMKRLGLHHRPTLRENYVTPAIGLGLIAMTIPDKPNSRLQKYRLTERGNVVIKKGEQGPL